MGRLGGSIAVRTRSPAGDGAVVSKGVGAVVRDGREKREAWIVMRVWLWCVACEGREDEDKGERKMVRCDSTGSQTLKSPIQNYLWCPQFGSSQIFSFLFLSVAHSYPVRHM